MPASAAGVEAGHELAAGGAGRGEVLVAFGELELQVGGFLLEIGDLLVEGVDVGGRAEPGLVPGLLAERFGQPFLELADAGGEPDGALAGGEQVRLQGCAVGRRPRHEASPPTPNRVCDPPYRVLRRVVAGRLTVRG